MYVYVKLSRTPCAHFPQQPFALFTFCRLHRLASPRHCQLRPEFLRTPLLMCFQFRYAFIMHVISLTVYF